MVHPAGGRDGLVKSLWTKVTGKKYDGELDPDLDHFVIVILRERGCL